MKHILVIGDSWAMGEWSLVKPENISGRMIRSSYGFAEMLEMDGYYVYYCAQPAASPKNCIDFLKSYINRISVDLIIWLDTDPCRDLNIETLSDYKDKINILQSLETFNSWLPNHMIGIYNELNDLNIPVWIIGASVDHNIEWSSRFCNLEPIIPSLKNFLNSSYTDQIFFGYATTYLIGLMRDSVHIEQETKDLLLANYQKITQHFEDNSKIYPDAYHPGKEGHKKIFNFLKTRLTL